MASENHRARGKRSSCIAAMIMRRAGAVSISQESTICCHECIAKCRLGLQLQRRNRRRSLSVVNTKIPPSRCKQVPCPCSSQQFHLFMSSRVSRVVACQRPAHVDKNISEVRSEKYVTVCICRCVFPQPRLVAKCPDHYCQSEDGKLAKIHRITYQNFSVSTAVLQTSEPSSPLSQAPPSQHSIGDQMHRAWNGTHQRAYTKAWDERW